MKIQAYHRPASLDEVLGLLASSDDAACIAGGTDLLVPGSPPPPILVSLRSVPELTGIASSDTAGTRIGAATTITDVARHPGLAADYPVLVAAARRIGSEQIRNVATVGGNLCRAAPCADLAPPLFVLEAHAEIVGAGGTREVPIEEFFTGPGATCLAPGEVLAAVRLEPPRPGAVGRFLKKGRVRMDLSIASVALLLEAEDGRCRRIRLAAGSVAPTPLRLQPVEALLEGAELTDEVLGAAAALAAETVKPITDVRSTESYRRRIVGVYVKRGITQALAGDEA